MLLKTVLLIIANQGYQSLEYGLTRKILEEDDIKVEIASNIKQTAHAAPNSNKCLLMDNDYQTAPVDLQLAEVNAGIYDGIFIIGGPGALESLDNQVTYNIMQTIAKAKKPFGAICISPRILAVAGLLNGKKATGWDEDNKLTHLFYAHNITYIKEPVVTDGHIVTASGPSAAQDFGKAIVTLLKKP